MNQEEEWRDILDERLTNYEVSSLGRIRNKNTGCIRKAWDNGHGYLSVGFKHNGKHINVYVHRLVAESFIAPIPEGYEIDHYDWDTTNNSVDNLRIVSHSQNQLHRQDYESRRLA